MTPDPILSAPLAVQLHLAAALPAVLLGPVVLFRNSRDRLHKVLGYIWIAAIVALSVTGLVIPSEFPLIGPFGPIHLFSLFALWGVGEGWFHIRRGNVAGHLAAMQSVWFGAVGLAGLFTLNAGADAEPRALRRTLRRGLFRDGDRRGHPRPSVAPPPALATARGRRKIRLEVPRGLV